MAMRLLVSAIVISAFAQGAAFAQTGQGGQNQSSGGSLPSQLQQKLRSQGFTDIEVVPEGYIVSAKDRDGDPVTMIVGPHSLAIFEETNPQNVAANRRGGQGNYGGGQGSYGSGQGNYGGGQGNFGGGQGNYGGGQGRWGQGGGWNQGSTNAGQGSYGYNQQQ